MNIACPECRTIFRVDPKRIPEQGVTARCRQCGTAFQVTRQLGGRAPGQDVTAPRTAFDTAGESEREGTSTAPGPARPTETASSGEGAAAAPARGEAAPAFGPQDPHTRARRLARALISDIKAYHPDRWEEAIRAGTLRTSFRNEVMKSWQEYVEQVGEEMAKKTPYFRNALNEILAQGERMF